MTKSENDIISRKSQNDYNIKCVKEFIHKICTDKTRPLANIDRSLDALFNKCTRLKNTKYTCNGKRLYKILQIINILTESLIFSHKKCIFIKWIALSQLKY